MHDYLRAIGFSKIKKNKDVRDILNLVMLRPTSEYVSSAADEEAVFGEKVKEFADRMGISVRGEYDENGQFHVGYYFPYFKAKNPTLKDEVTIEKQSDRDAYADVYKRQGESYLPLGDEEAEALEQAKQYGMGNE